MMKENKIIIITGGTGNLGREIARALASGGNKIYIPTRNIEKFKKIFDNSQSTAEYTFDKIYSLECDVTDIQSVREFINSVSGIEKGKIDCLINTVGGYHPPVNLVDSDDNIFDDYINKNIRSVYYFSKEAAKLMINNNYGRIISISSLASNKITPGLYYYTMTKNAVNILMHTLASELKSYNIRCNTILPGTIDTPENREWGNESDIKKWISPKKVAKIIEKLISEDFDDVNSSEIIITGNL